jgi:hypothetical protein
MLARLIASALLLSAALLAGCAGECSKASDCAHDEVCYKEICTKGQSSSFERTCNVDSDCDTDMDGKQVTVCTLGRCRFPNRGPIMTLDTGTSTDAGP